MPPSPPKIRANRPMLFVPPPRSSVSFTHAQRMAAIGISTPDTAKPIAANAAARTPATATAFISPCASCGFSLTHAPITDSQRLPLSSRSLMAGISVIPNSAPVLNNWFLNSCHLLDIASARVSNSRAMLPLAASLLASSSCRRHSSVLETSVANTLLYSPPAKPLRKPACFSLGIFFTASMMLITVALASVTMPFCTALASMPKPFRASRTGFISGAVERRVKREETALAAVDSSTPEESRVEPRAAVFLSLIFASPIEPETRFMYSISSAPLDRELSSK